MDKRKRDTLRNKLARTARNNCANYQGCNECPLFAAGCIVQIPTDTMRGNVCPYFMRYVLPVDPELMDDYLQYFPDDYPLKKAKGAKRCDRCKQSYTPTSNRQKYCKGCGTINEKEQALIRQRKKRLNDAINATV